MTLFDYVVLGIIGASVLLGLWRGVVSELLALAAWVLAFFAARMMGATVAGWLGGVIADPLLRQGAGFVAVFVAVLVVVALVRLLLRELLRAVGLGLIDRMLGAVFGILRGLAVALAGVLAGGMTSLPKEAWWHDAMLAPPLETAVLAGKPWLPADVAKRIRYR
ncbi:MAG: CvpA family protein [Rhodocyclaceae bacterium]|nr:MAG: CvpA family protein [Rhodocyclaceae bacterium]